MKEENIIQNTLTKICTKCSEQKSISEYNKQKKGLFGVSAWCRKCTKEYHRINRELINESKRKYYKLNVDAIKETKKEYRKQNKELINKYKIKNKDYIKKYLKEYKTLNKKLLNESRRKQVNARRLVDSKFRIIGNIRNRLNQAYRRGLVTKKISTTSIISQETFNKLIETAPKTKGFHIDHIIPLSAFDLNNVEHIKLANSIENLQWLPSKENISKKDSIDWRLIESNPHLIEIANIIGLTNNKNQT